MSREMSLKKTLGLIIGLSLFVHLFSLWANKTFLKGWVFVSNPLHSSVEMAGSVIAIFVSFFLVKLPLTKETSKYEIVIASALVGMGVIDGLHALLEPGKAFVWLHSFATFLGGLIFSFLWLPFNRKIINLVTLGTLMTGILVSLYSIFDSGFLPEMVINGEFTVFAVMLNVSGGCFFFIGAFKLYLNYRKNSDIDTFLFFLHCALFGAAAIMFRESKLWDFSWWGWHVLRLMAYGVAMYYVLKSLIRRAKAERELLLQKVIFTSKLASVGELAAGIGHEVKNPLNIADGNTKIIAEELNKKEYSLEKVKTHLDFISKSHKRISKIVDGLRVYARHDLESFKKISIHNVVKNTLDLVEPLYLKESVVVEFEDNSEKELYIVGNEGELQQVLMNMLNNAKYVLTGLSHKKILIRLSSEEDSVRLEVIDNGAGIPKNIINKIFDPFFTTKPTGEGTGLGLGLSREIIRRIGGDIDVSSIENKGTIFLIKIPVAS